MKGELEKAYLAGFFDGEGCIWINCSGNYQLQIGVAQKYPAVLHRYVNLWGGKIYNANGCHRWMPGARESEKVLRDLLPYLYEKKSQAILALMFLRRKKRKQLSHTQQFYCYRALKALKRIPAHQHNLAEIRRIFRKETGNS